ncbi:MAG: insulinase family protein [Ruminococcaceae bacterium]|nr:insulinase family protein [Oscillospiraceae bacterium]
MKIQKIENKTIGETYYSAEHPSGLKILVLPKKDYQTNYALFGTKFGSADSCFVTAAGETITLPDGTAHFLEHKLFESEEKDAFEKFALTGARANAYTSFDRTCYLFSCSQNFYENLESLIDFVSEPYFTAQTIQKEQGIIGQEIKMYRDNPSWQAMMGLLGALYHHCAVNTDIAGSVESIARITAPTLYAAYEGFYVPSNMVLCVCGDVDVQRVIDICDAHIRFADRQAAKAAPPEEPSEVKETKVRREMSVSIPVFAFGYKEECTGIKSLKERVETVVLNQILIGTMSPLYEQLLQEGLIGEDFSSEYFCGRNYAAVLFEGTGEHGEEIKQRFEQEVARVRREGIDRELLDCVIKELYGTMIKGFNSVEDIASELMESEIGGYGLFDEWELYQSLTPEDIKKCLETKYDTSRAAIALIVPTQIG